MNLHLGHRRRRPVGNESWFCQNGSAVIASEHVSINGAVHVHPADWNEIEHTCLGFSRHVLHADSIHLVGVNYNMKFRTAQHALITL